MSGLRMPQTIAIARWLDESGVAFGTSGVRGLVADMRDDVCFAYTQAFLEHMRDLRAIGATTRVALAGDRRASTPRIVAACAAAVRHLGHTPVWCGLVPTPAVALFGLQQGIPAVMVTGSHIPDDRNGIKFYRPGGEVLKEDEAAIREREITLPDAFDDAGMLAVAEPLPAEDGSAAATYRQRFISAFGRGALTGSKVGLYGHSAVGRELTEAILRELGADVVRLGFSEAFVAVDTEAIRPTDIALARRWARDFDVHAIVSTDGDGDRPLVSDETGRWLRGDVAALLCARHLGVSTVVTPVSSSSVAEASGWFSAVDRTRIGSPWVISRMLQRIATGHERVAGYEANGGFLSASPLPAPAAEISALPTRDALIVILAILHAANRRGVPVSALPAELPPRATFSDRLQDIPREVTSRRIDELAAAGRPAMAALIDGTLGDVVAVDRTDGLRMTFIGGEVVHLRASGNAPELRCYTEATDEDRAREIAARVLAAVAAWR
jgi:phosphomannomutase